MIPERWRQVDQLFHLAFEREPEDRAAFLDQACGRDVELRREVESLLAADAQTTAKLNPAQFVAEMLADKQTGEVIGQQITHYRILAPLGKGGMGEVFLAQDISLNRQVALKLLPRQFTADTERVHRFEREARAASALNHPNILTIHEIGQSDATHFIVTEYIQGQTLRQQMKAARMSLPAAVEMAFQIATALGAAHEAGIIHRDIKPENVMVRQDGIVKVLDFGLAKLTEQSSGEEAIGLAGITTESGVVMGTPRYMSTEQARGQKVDARTDIFSLGVMLYEMIAGRRPFEGETASDVMAAILTTEPEPLAQHAPEVPSELERIVTKTLRKDREERYQSVKDLLVDLRKLKQGLEAEARAGSIDRGAADATTQSSAEYLLGELKRHKKGALLALAVLVVAVGGTGFGLYRFITQSQSKGSGTEPKIVPFTSFQGEETQPAFSPDGKQLAYVWGGEGNDNQDIYVKLIGVGTSLRLTTNPATDSSPVWTPDGRQLAFLRQSAEGNGVYLVSALGGPERKIADASGLISTNGTPLRLAWHPQGELLALSERSSAIESSSFSIFLLSVETGDKQKLTTPPAQYFGDWNPAFSPDGKTLAFTRGVNGINQDIYLVPVSGGEPRRLTFDGAHVKSLAWTANGREIVFSSSRGGSINTSALWKIPAAGGTPERLTGIGQNAFTLAIDRQGNRLAFEQRFLDTNIYRLDTAVSTSQSGPPTKLISSTFQDDSPAYSPDGKRIAFVSDRTGVMELWLCDSDGTNPVPLTSFGRSQTGSPRWSPDGRQIVFDSGVESGIDDNQELFIISAEGGKPRRLTFDAALDMMPVWSRDGRWIFFVSNRGGDLQLWKVPTEGGQAQPLTRQGAGRPVESADGKFIYYAKGGGPGELAIWRVPVEGGAETQILEPQKAVSRRSWAIVEKGIYFAVPETPTTAVLKFFSFDTGRIEQRGATMGQPLIQGPTGLTISPDGRWILYPRIEQSGSDIMLMENFRVR